MARAEITLPSGGKVTVDGTEAEIKEILDHYSGKGEEGQARRLSRGVASSSPSGPVGLVRDLIAEDFFKEKRSLGAIQARLAEAGHIYPQSTLSATMLKVLKKRELRRMREKGAWVYVNR